MVADSRARRARVVGALVGLGLLACAAAATMGWPHEAHHGAWAGRLLRTYAVLWACYLAAALIVTRSRVWPKWTLLTIIGVAALLHVLIYVNPMPMSTDSYRYVWDGHLMVHGVNPYEYEPDDSDIAYLREGNYARMEFHYVHTLYPPGVEGLFALLARIRETDRVAFLWAFMAFNVGISLVLIPLLRRSGRRAEEVIWYAWNPLPIMETAAGGHLDVVWVFFLVLALLLAARARGSIGSAVAYAFSVLCKGPAALVFPFFAWRGRWRFAAVFVLVIGVSFLPFIRAGKHIFDGLSYYFAYWEVNGSISIALRRAYEFMHGIDPNHRSAAVIKHDVGLVRAITNSLLFVFLLWQLRRRRPDMEWLLSATFGLLAAYLLLGAPVYPWYVSATVPLLCFWRVPGWTWFTFTVFAQYYARWLVPGPYHDLLLVIGYVPVYGLLILQWVKWREAARLQPTTAAASEAAAPQ